MGLDIFDFMKAAGAGLQTKADSIAEEKKL